MEMHNTTRGAVLSELCVVCSVKVSRPSNELTDEKITALVVGNFPALGKLAAMWFIERVQANPGGVVSLPTVPEDQDLSRTRVVPGAPESPHPGDARTGVPERAQPGRVLSAQQRDAACRGKQVNTRSVLLQC